MNHRREYWISAGMAFANAVDGGIHVREVLPGDDDQPEALVEAAKAITDPTYDVGNRECVEVPLRKIQALRESVEGGSDE